MVQECRPQGPLWPWGHPQANREPAQHPCWALELQDQQGEAWGWVTWIPLTTVTRFRVLSGPVRCPARPGGSVDHAWSGQHGTWDGRPSVSRSLESYSL